MSIGATNRIYNSSKERAYALERAVKDRLIEKNLSKKRQDRGYQKHFHIKTAKCTQCARGMDMRIAKQQIENNRENAPICIPCIVGIARKPLADFK